VTDVLSGKANPSGKLTMTMPIQYEDLSTSKNFIQNPSEVKYKEGIYVGYRYFDSFKIKPAYEFGYGLSYTTFEFSNLTISNSQFKDKVTVTITVKNTGKTSGKEVVQLYLAAPTGKIDKPFRELKSFGKTKLLKPGEEQIISFILESKDLASFHSNQNAWIAEAGAYKVYIGSSSKKCENSIPFTLLNEIIVEKVSKAFIPELGFSDLKQ
jgi:beta-glucosidase